MKRLFCTIWLFVLVLLSACVAEERIHLEERFVSWFRPTQEAYALLIDNGVYSPNIWVEYEDVTIYLRQIMGNPYVLYLAVDIVGEDLSINQATLSGVFTERNESWSVFTGGGIAKIHGCMDLPGGYIIRFFFESPLDIEQELVMQMDVNQVPVDPSSENFIFGLYELAFVPRVNAPVREMLFLDDTGTNIGTLSASVLHIHFVFWDTDDLLDPDFPSQTPVRIVMEDDTYRTLRGPILTQSLEMEGSTRWSIWSECRQLWEPHRIVAVEIGEVRMRLYDKTLVHGG